ncbi:MAG TPA: SUMF1/EgtB/PvdO family nonheme iron enzyme [Planctomycetota bacterium]|nr:SUMF1/EgtB/PvdO family nonheme iron enzyme [Planctomycetota bacterium]
MKNIIWKISIQRKGTEYGLSENNVLGKLRYYIQTDTKKRLTLGSSSDADIFISHSHPIHAILQIDTGNFHIIAKRKFIRQIKNQSVIMQKEEEFSIPLEDCFENPIMMKIKDTKFKITFEEDMQYLSKDSVTMQYLTEQYGELEKVSEGNIYFIYRSKQHPSLILKILKPNYSTPKMWQKFFIVFQEVQNKKIKHTPGVVDYIEEHNLGIYGFIYNIPSGETLKQIVVAKKVLPIVWLYPFFETLTTFLKQVHKDNKTYCNLAPDNILVDSNGKIIITGFSALYRNNLLQFIGKKVYASFTPPEEIKDSKNNDNRSDIFSLGSLLYYTLLGTTSFGKRNGVEYLHQLKQGLPDPIFPEEKTEDNQLLFEFQDIIVKCLQVKVQNRYQTVEDFWQDFKKVANQILPRQKKQDDFFINIEDHGLENLPKMDITFPVDEESVVNREDFQEKDSTNFPTNFPSFTDGITLPADNVLATGGTVSRNISTNFWYVFYKSILRHQFIIILPLITFCILLLLSFYAFIVNPFFEKRHKLDNIRQQADQMHKEYYQEYIQKVTTIRKNVDSQGLSPESIAIEREMLIQLEQDANKQFKQQLTAEILPRWHFTFQQSQIKKDSEKILNILEQVLKLCKNEEEKQPFRAEIAQLKGDNLNDFHQHAKVNITGLPDQSSAYLYRFEESDIGVKIIYPVNVETGERVFLREEEQTHLDKKINFLRAQSLVYEGGLKMLQNNHIVAETSFLRAIEIAPDYLDAYFLLCCNKKLESYAKTKTSCDFFIRNFFIKELNTLNSLKTARGRNEEMISQEFTEKDLLETYSQATHYCELCVQTAKRLIRFYFVNQLKQENISKKTETYLQKEQKRLEDCFDPENINKILKIYSYFVRNKGELSYVLKVSSEPFYNKETEIQKDDYILQMNENFVMDKQELQDQVKNKKSIDCQILRNGDFMTIKITQNDLQDPYFQLQEVPPFFYINNNQYLNFNPDESIHTFAKFPANSVQEKELYLPLGSYLLYIETPNQISCQYPFEVYREQNTGKPFASSIFLQLPIFTKEKEYKYKELFQEFVFIPSEFTTREENAQKMYKNQYGFLIGKYEVTLAQWKEYLEDLYKKENNWEKILDYVPKWNEDSYLFYLKDDNITLQIGELTWPVFGITYHQIKNYLRWRTSQLPEVLRKTGLEFRLPTQEEWEIAAQGSDKRPFPWGTYPNPRFCNTAVSRKGTPSLEPIRKYNPSYLYDESPFGVYNMAGGVLEYTEDGKNINRSYSYIVKGNSWKDTSLHNMEYVHAYSGFTPETHCGFRICAGIDPIM